MSRRIRCSVCGLLHDSEDIRKLKNGRNICTDCIENSDGKYVECDICHKVEERGLQTGAISDGDYIAITQVEGKNVCDECRDLHAFVCQDCGRWVFKENLTLIGQTLICVRCESHIEECDRCQNRIHRTNLRTVHTNNGDMRVCTTCANNYRRCRDCGEYFETSMLTRVYPNYEFVCENCRNENEYEVCTSCGHLISSTNIIREDDDGDEIDPICSECYNRQNVVIHGYHNDEHFIKRYTEEDAENEPLLLGLEIEVGGSETYAKGLLKLFRPENDIMLMHDGSVRGFEIVTNPMTYKYIQKKFYPKLKEGMKYLIDHNFKGHNAGGIHIHISEEAVTKYQVAQLGEILYGNKNDYETWLILTQRKRENTSWCRFERNMNFYNVTDHSQEKPPVDSQRHTALNHDTRTGTYEFRIFNSSLRMDRIKKNIQCVIALLDYTSDHKYEERPVCNLTKFLEYVASRKIFYPELAAFIEEKNLLEAHKSKNYSACNTVEVERNEVCA